MVGSPPAIAKVTVPNPLKLEGKVAFSMGAGWAGSTGGVKVYEAVSISWFVLGAKPETIMVHGSAPLAIVWPVLVPQPK